MFLLGNIFCLGCAFVQRSMEINKFLLLHLTRTTAAKRQKIAHKNWIYENSAHSREWNGKKKKPHGIVFGRRSVLWTWLRSVIYIRYVWRTATECRNQQTTNDKIILQKRSDRSFVLHVWLFYFFFYGILFNMRVFVWRSYVSFVYMTVWYFMCWHADRLSVAVCRFVGSTADDDVQRMCLVCVCLCCICHSLSVLYLISTRKIEIKSYLSPQKRDDELLRFTHNVWMNECMVYSFLTLISLYVGRNRGR